MDIASGIALAVALLSALFAGLAWRETRRQAIASRDMLKIEQQRDSKAVERSRAARVAPKIVRERDEKNRLKSRLQVVNEGEAIARGVEVGLEPIAGDEGHLPLFLDQTFPCDLPSGHNAEVHLTVVMDTAARVRLTTSWTDDRGRQEEEFISPVY